jgi:hypothetical protein
MEEGKREKRSKSVKGNSEPRSGSSVVVRPVIRKFNRVAVVESFPGSLPALQGCHP